MLLDGMILIAQPRLAALRLRAAVAQDGIPRDPPEPGQARDGAPQAQRQARVGVVEPDDENAARTYEARHGGERRPRIGSVVQDTRANHDVERLAREPRRPQVRLHEGNAGESVAPGRRARERERGARQVGADDDAVRARQKQAQLSRPAPQLQHGRVAGNRLVQPPRELAAGGAGTQGRKAVARRVAGKWRPRVERAHSLGTWIGRESQIGNAAGRGVLLRAGGAAKARRGKWGTARAPA